MTTYPTSPTGPIGSPSQGREQHVIVGATAPVTCQQLPQLSS